MGMVRHFTVIGQSDFKLLQIYVHRFIQPVPYLAISTALII